MKNLASCDGHMELKFWMGRSQVHTTRLSWGQSRRIQIRTRSRNPNGQLRIQSDWIKSVRNEALTLPCSPSAELHTMYAGWLAGLVFS